VLGPRTPGLVHFALRHLQVVAHCFTTGAVLHVDYTNRARTLLQTWTCYTDTNCFIYSSGGGTCIATHCTLRQRVQTLCAHTFSFLSSLTERGGFGCYCTAKRSLLGSNDRCCIF